MFVLGIDPGLSRCGFAVLESHRAGRAKPLCLGVIRTDKDLPTPQRLAELASEVRSLMDEFNPSVVSVERIFFQNNVHTAVKVAQAAGLVLAEAASRGLEVAQYSPNQVKAAIAGDGRADKAAVQSMVATLLRLSAAPQPADAADAAAIALCYLAYNPAGGRPTEARRKVDSSR